MLLRLIEKKFFKIHDRNGRKLTIASIGGWMQTDLHGKVKMYYKLWYSSNMLNMIRRIISPVILKLKYKLGMGGARPLLLHLGCGTRRFQGYANIDLRKTKATDLVCDIKKLPYPDASVDLIETYHVIEHLPRNDMPKALNEWFRVIVPGGGLIIECPDFDKVVLEYIEGNEIRIDNIFGLQRFHGDAHLFGYNFKRLKKILKDAGFNNIKSLSDNPNGF